MGLQTHLPVEILDYIRTHETPGEQSYGIGQTELASALGYHPCSMSRPLDSLVRSGQLAVQRGAVRDAARKRLTYRITSVGLSRLRRETSGVPLITGELPPPPHPFLGRKVELDTLASVADSGAAVTIIDGQAGMGKTALVSRFLRRSSQGRIPFWYTVRSASSARQVVSALAHALSSLGRPQLAYYAQLPRNPLPRECADLAARALEEKTLAAVVDDFHLAGPDLRGFILEFFSALGARGRHQLYILGQAIPELALDRVTVHRVTLGGLDRAAAHELTDRQGGLSDRFEDVYRVTLGSPLLLKLAVSRPGVATEALDLPAAAVAKLGSGELRALTPAAVANEPLPAQFLLEEGPLTEDRLKDLARGGILQPALHGQYEVLQAIRSALLARIDPGDERHAHRRLAQYYARSHRPEPLRERFLHLVHGEQWREAAELLSSREREIFRLGYSEALRAAIRSLVSGLPPGSAKVRTYLCEATLLRQHSDFAEAILSLRRAIGLAPDDARLRKEAMLRVVDLHLKLGEVDAAQSEFEKAQKVRTASRRLDAYTVLTEARLDEGRGEWKRASSEYQRAFELSRRVHAADLALESIASWSKFAEGTSGPEVALRLIRQALPNARQSGHMDVVFNLRLARARAYSDTGKQDLAEEEVAAVRGEAEALGYLTQLTYALSGLAAVATERQQWAACSAYAKQAGELAERLGNNLVLGHTLATLCAAEFRQAHPDGNPWLLKEALDHGLRGVEVLKQTAPSDSLVFAHTYLVEIYLFTKRPAEAVAHYDAAIAIAEGLGLTRLAGLTAENLGPQVDEARKQIEKGSRLPESGA